MRRVVYFHSEDLDGWLAAPNLPLTEHTAALLARMQGLTLEQDGVVHEVQIILNSGKAPEYLEREARKFGGRYVISANGACWREVGEATRRLIPRSPDFDILRGLIGLTPDDREVVRLKLPRVGGDVEAALEDKRDREGEIVFSLFPEPEPVAHRWTFAGGVDRDTLKGILERLIEEHGLALHVAPPHADGAVDVLPLLNGTPVGKWTLPLLARRIFPDAELRLTHGGDAVNDLSAMEAEGVLPLTAHHCPLTAEVAGRRGGVVAQSRAPEAAVMECYAELARRGFYGPLSERVALICGR